MSALAPSPFRGLALNRLAVPRAFFQETLDFYSKSFGMTVQRNPSSPDRAIAGYSIEGGMALDLHATDGPPGESSGYWKIGVGLPDVNVAAARLRDEHSVDVKPANQFLDVGFLTHLKDPAGNTIELLQDTFESNFKPCPVSALPLACDSPKIGQLTLRVTNIERSLAFYRDTLGMRLLCAYDVGDYGFRLYFLAFTDDAPPSADLDAVENREWTYSRPYTTLELFTKPAAQDAETYAAAAENEAGWRGLSVALAGDPAAAEARLKAAGVAGLDRDERGTLCCRDPDGFPVIFPPPEDCFVVGRL